MLKYIKRPETIKPEKYTMNEDEVERLLWENIVRIKKDHRSKIKIYPVQYPESNIDFIPYFMLEHKDELASLGYKVKKNNILTGFYDPLNYITMSWRR